MSIDKKISGAIAAENTSTLDKVINYAKGHLSLIVLIAVSYFVATIVNLLSVASGQSVAAFNVEDFELGQISDRTIIAAKSIPADDDFPIDITEGEKILRKGFPVTEDAYMKLRKMSQSPIYLDYRAFANTELYLLILAIVWCLFFATIGKSLLRSGRQWDIKQFAYQVACFLIVYATVSFGQKTVYFQTSFSICVITCATLFVLIESLLYGALNAVFFSIILAFTVFNATGYQAVPFLYTLTSSLFVSVIAKKIERRIDLGLTAVVSAFVNSVIIVILSVIFNASIPSLIFVILGVAANGVLSGILALGLITPLELILNTASIFRLMDLSDLNTPIMRKMLLMASGTYQHSLMVAQLSEAAARDIGANALLARVGSYYHDIGKIDQSEYFTENQTNKVNKHKEISINLSVSVIRSHVKRGMEKARILHLPQAVIDIIEEHHGNGIIAYFFNKAQEIDPNVNPADFSYTGRMPTTKESGIVMLADTVEAACRSLDNPTKANIEDFMKKLIQTKIDSHFLDNCELTFRDLDKSSNAFLNVLVSYYHNRIAYPNQKSETEKPAQSDDGESEGANSSQSEKKPSQETDTPSATSEEDDEPAQKPSQQKQGDASSLQEKNDKQDKLDKSDKLDKLEKASNLNKLDRADNLDAQVRKVTR